MSRAPKLRLHVRTDPPAIEVEGICGACGRAGAKPYPWVSLGERRERFRCEEHVPDDARARS